MYFVRNEAYMQASILISDAHYIYNCGSRYMRDQPGREVMKTPTMLSKRRP